MPSENPILVRQSLSIGRLSFGKTVLETISVTKNAAILALALHSVGCADDALETSTTGAGGTQTVSSGGNGGNGGIDFNPSTGGSGGCIDGDTRTCGTSEGSCEEGIQTCVDGAWDEECEGQTAPILEICADNVDQDCDGVNDNGCDVTLSFPALTGTDCYKAVHFLSGGTMIQQASSTPDGNFCIKQSVSGTYQPGDRAQAWFQGDELKFDASESPKTIDLRCSPFTTHPDWQDSLAAVEATDYSDPMNTAELGTLELDGQTYTYPLTGCDEYDVRLTY